MNTLFTLVFWKTAAENVAIGAAGAVTPVLTPHVTELFAHVPWGSAGVGAIGGGLLGLCYSLLSLKVKNGLASVVQDAVAVPKPEGHGWNPVNPLGD